MTEQPPQDEPLPPPPPPPSTAPARDLVTVDDDIVDAEIIERAAERAASAAVQKFIVELRETNPSAPNADDLLALKADPRVFEEYVRFWQMDLDRRWEYTRADQLHDHKMQENAQANQYALDTKQVDALTQTLKNSPKYALVFGLAGLIVAALVAIFESAIAGGVIAALDITTGIGLFLYGKNTDNKRPQETPGQQLERTDDAAQGG